VDDFDRKIAGLGFSKKIGRGESLFQAGDRAEGFYRVTAGEIRVYKINREGKEIEVVRLRPGDFFGEAIYFARGTFPAYARAVKDAEVLYFPGRLIADTISRDPSVASLFLEVLARKCLVLNERVEALGLRTVRQRLARFILSRSGDTGGSVFDLEISKAELARQIGTIPETLSRVLRRLGDEGLIEVRGKTVFVKDGARLRDAAGI
jgi:CRP/FNR family transcriptional regulator, dissimilatory nitrate respiration regulator